MFLTAFVVSFVHQLFASCKLLGFLLGKSVPLALTYLDARFLTAHLCLGLCNQQQVTKNGISGFIF